MRAKEFISKPHLYLDMDGVQADFFTAWAKLFGKERYKDIGDRAAREASISDLNQRGPDFVRRFFATLPVLPGAAELIAFLRDNQIPYTVLSAPLRGNEEASIEGKRIWLDRHHPGTSQDAIFTSEKQRYATTGGQSNVLVDDFKKYINAWQADGGIAVLYRWNNVASAIERLKKIYGIDQQDIEENLADGHTPADAVLDYVKRKHHDFRINREVLMYPRWQLTKIPLSNLIIADYTDSDIDLDQVDAVKRDPERKINQSPIVVDPAGAIIDGNHRAFAARELGMTHIPAWRPVDDLDENFADGKVSGKSRPGRVKRAGASCKGSVTDLRARAKKYGGERGKMYHWCANMKSGRKK